MPSVNYDCTNTAGTGDGGDGDLTLYNIEIVGGARRQGLTESSIGSLRVRVTDKTSGLPIIGAIVTFTPTIAADGATVILSSPTAITDTDGIAAVTATANNENGLFNVVVSVIDDSNCTFVDSFTGVGLLHIHTSDSGHTWDDTTSFYGSNPDTLFLAGGLLKLTDNQFGEAISNWAPTSPDYYVEASVHLGENNNDYVLGGRVHPIDNNNANMYQVEAYVTSGNVYYNLYWVDYTSGYTTLDSSSDSIVFPLTVKLRLEMQGTAIRLLVNGVVRASATDSNISAAGAVWHSISPDSSVSNTLTLKYIKADYL